MGTTTATPTFEQSKFDAFMGKAVMDMGAAMHAALMVIGDKLGLYKAMAGAGPLTPAELAAKTKTTERYVREWLNANAASGYVTYDAASKKFELPPEQAFALTTVDLPGAFHIISACFKDEPKITQAFRTGDGVGWHEHDANLFFGTERFFRPNYEQNLLSGWIPVFGRGWRQACQRRLGCRCWLRTRRFDDADGQGVSEVAIHRIRLSQWVDRICAPRCRTRWASRSDQLRGCEFEELSREWRLRSRYFLRLPA